MSAASDLERRRARLVAALGALLVKDGRGEFPELRAFHAWLDSWRGIGHVVVGMERQGYDLTLARDNRHAWGARFYPTGRVHSDTWQTGYGRAETPWAAVQRAAWAALNAKEPERQDWSFVDDSPR